MAPPKKIRLRSPEGELFEVGEIEARELRRRKFRDDTPEDVVASTRRISKRKQAETPEETLRALRDAGFRGISGGLSDVAAVKIFGADPEAIRARQEALGGVGTALEVTGLLASSFAGAGLLGKGAKSIASFSPVGLASRGSVATGNIIKNRLGGGALATAAGLVAEGTLDASLYGAAKKAADLTLQDKEITMEAVVGGALESAPFGAGGGLLAFGAGKLANRLKQPKIRGTVTIPKESQAILTTKFAQQVDEIDGVTKIAKALAESDELVAARKALDELIGESATGESLSKAWSNITLENAEQLGKAYDNYLEAAVKAAPTKAAAESIEQSTELLRTELRKVAELHLPEGAIDKSLGALETIGAVELAAGAVGEDIIPDGSFADTALKLAAGGAFLSGRGKPARGLRKFLENTVLGGVRGAGGQLAGSAATRFGASPTVASGARIAGFSAAGQAGRSAIKSQPAKKVATLVGGDISEMIRAQNASRRRIASALDKVSKTATRVAPKIRVKEILSEALLDSPEPSEKNESRPQQFKRKVDSFNKLMGNPDRLHAKSYEFAQGLMLIDPELGQLAQQQYLTKLQFLHSKLPQDPGTQNGLLGSSWLPDEFAIDEFMRYYEATIDPPSVAELFSRGQLTPQAAEALKETAPAHFREIQRVIAANPERLQKMSYERRVQLGFLYDVPTDPMLNITSDLQDHFGEEAQQGQDQPMTTPPVQGPVKTQNQLSPTQELTLSSE